MQYYMGLVFSAPHNDVFLVSALKTLPLDDVVVWARDRRSRGLHRTLLVLGVLLQATLQQLKAWVGQYIEYGDKVLRRRYRPARIPSFKQVRNAIHVHRAAE